MKVKAKLLLGVGSLFGMIILMTVLSSIYINKLSGETHNILTDNYNTIDYCRQMIIAINRDISKPDNAARFRESLARQKANVTEAGEDMLTKKLEMDFLRLKVNPEDTITRKKLTEDITGIMLLNMQAIQQKSKLAQNTASNSLFWITLAGTLCFIIALTIWFNLPGSIANPIRELTASIKEIAGQNYSQRVHFEKHNEFGQLAAAFNTMAEKLQEYQAGNMEKLMMEKKRIETLIDNMKDPVLGLNTDKTILFINDVALQVTGLKRNEIAGVPVQEIALKNDLIRDLVKDLFTDPEEKNTVINPAIKIYADNKESYFEKDIIPIKITPTGETAEKHIGNVIVLRNITPYKELDFAKTNFIATVSHELKTPISSIKLGLQLLENKDIGVLNEEQQKLLEGIEEDAARLLKITAELLNMTQVESGSIQLNVAPVSVADIIDYAVKANRAAAEEKQIEVAVHIAPDIPNVLADKDKTSWVLTNLLSNAIRYSYDNSQVSIKAVSSENRILFTVADSGQGIAPEYINKIFQKYFRVPGSKKEGTGLGLSISKEFIEAEGGMLTVNSNFGVGSTFSLYLNMAK